MGTEPDLDKLLSSIPNGALTIKHSAFLIAGMTRSGKSAGGLPVRWRAVFTDSESCDGVAPVCTATGDADQHPVLHGARDEAGVYDCCPRPVIETQSETTADDLVTLLNNNVGGGR